MIVSIPIPLPSAANLREHWTARHRRIKSQRVAVAWVINNKPRPDLPCIVTLTRISPRKLDDDNLQGAFKGVRDEVADWLGVDDGDSRVTWLYAQRKGKASIEVAIAGVVEVWP
jgi:hypothetical protein